MTPPLPHGNPILDPNDHTLLGSFFSNLQSDHWMQFGDSLNFSDQWSGHVAPNFVGHSTSFGPQPPPDLASAAITELPPANLPGTFTFVRRVMPPPPPPIRQQPLHQPQPQPQPTLTHFHQHPQFFHDQRFFHVPVEQDAHTDAAASLTTLQSGHTNAYSLNSLHPLPNTQPSRAYRNAFPQPHPIQDHCDPIRPQRSNEPEMLFTDMIFGSQESTAQRIAERPELQWGSDALFARNQGFVPPQHESSEALEKKRMVTVREALTLASSTPNTRASSPIGNKEASTHRVPETPNGYNKAEETPATPNRRRRRSRAKLEGEEDGEYKAQLPSKAMAKKRKSGGDLNESPDSSSVTQETAGKRRKSAPSQPKPPRENLTDAQKRENHIKSEQKRRGAIKEGFDDLTFIVPNLQNGGYSKSSMLNIAGEWLESLIKGNKLLDPEGENTP